jgi:hypothetical protein
MQLKQVTPHHRTFSSSSSQFTLVHYTYKSSTSRRRAMQY